MPLVTGGTIIIGRALDMHLLAIHEPLPRTRRCVAPCTVSSVQCIVYSVQCTVYVDVVGLWRLIVIFMRATAL